ncbi:MAG TPA: hypothetical protein VEC12_02465, partial [Bacteroidia bacterium]|nr:hypothetical protein [Bacteroidia bacterium]
MSVLISLLKNRWMALAVSLLSLSVAFYIDTYKEHKESNYGEIISGLEEHLNKRERFIEKTLANDSLLNSFLKEGLNNENRERLDKKGIVLIIYKDTTQVFWSSNVADPSIILHHPVKELDALQTPNGWYLLKKKKSGEYTYALLYHFYVQYQYQNRYLQNHFSPHTKIRHTALITANPIQELSPVRSIYGKKLFYIGLHPSRHKTFTVPIIILTLLGLWMFFVFLSIQYEWFIERHRPFAGTLFFGIVLALLKYLLIDLKFPSFLQSSSLFDPSIYASGLFSSLGSLLVNTVLLFVFVFTLSKQTESYYNEKSLSHKNWLQGLLFISSFFALILFTGFIITVIRSLVLDSKIPFDIANIIHFTWYSFIGLLITALLVTIHFLTTSLVYRYIERIKATSQQLVLYAAASVAIYNVYLWITGRLSLPTALQGPTYAFSLLLVFQLSAGFKVIQKTLAYVLVASVFVALLFYRFNIDKEHEMRKLYAIQLGDSQDIEAENIFRDIEHQIATDQRIHKYFTNALFSKRNLEKHIKQLYFSGYLSKYDIEIFDYDTSGNSYRQKNYYTHDVVDNLYNNSSQPTLSNYFYYILNPSVQYTYIAKYDFCVGTTNVGSLYILLKKKLIQDQSLFNELLSQSSSAGMQPLYAYSYAMYQNNKLV